MPKCREKFGRFEKRAVKCCSTRKLLQLIISVLTHPTDSFRNSRAPLSVDLRAPCSSKTRLFNCEKVDRVDFMLVIPDQMFYFVKWRISLGSEILADGLRDLNIAKHPVRLWRMYSLGMSTLQFHAMSEKSRWTIFRLIILDPKDKWKITKVLWTRVLPDRPFRRLGAYKFVDQLFHAK